MPPPQNLVMTPECLVNFHFKENVRLSVSTLWSRQTCNMEQTSEGVEDTDGQYQLAISFHTSICLHANLAHKFTLSWYVAIMNRSVTPVAATAVILQGYLPKFIEHLNRPHLQLNTCVCQGEPEKYKTWNSTWAANATHDLCVWLRRLLPQKGPHGKLWCYS